MLELDALSYDPRAPLLFTSGTFLLLFALLILGYAVLALFAGTRERVRGAASLASPVDARVLKLGYLYLFSLFFYYKSSGAFVGLLVATSVVDFELARTIHASRHRWARRGCLALSLCTSLGILAYLKYGNFALDNVQALSGRVLPELDVVLPVGISFYTFQSVSYVVDVYRRRLVPSSSLLDYALYLAFFPQIVAGPIVRAEHMLPQLAAAKWPTSSDVRTGVYRALLGVFKKAAVADYLASYCDIVFSDYASLSGTEVLIGFYAYTLQIYFDFSGYSDIAIGLAKILGFALPENFDAPYRARSISEFWQRWHISLSSWLRDYLYVPLGGNRRGPVRRDANLLITMLLGGLWHGAAWQFVIWGLLHGLGLLLHKRWQKLGVSLPRALSWLVTFHFVVLGWTLFRAPTLSDWWGLTRRVTESRADTLHAIVVARSELLTVMLLAAAALFLPQGVGRWFERSFHVIPGWARACVAVLVLQGVLEMRQSEVTPFIYFQF